MVATDSIDHRISDQDPRLGSWRAFLQAHARVARRLDEELRAEHDLSVAEYDALLNIAEAPGRRIRMRQLSERVVLSKSGVTRLIDRLVADGLVERSACESDARGAEAVLTDAGLRRLRSASRTHLRGIADHFIDVLDTDQLAAVGQAMRAVADRAGAGSTDPGRCLPEARDAVPSARD
jgi:DNA-binding MarR family transcriptional regulator